MTTYGPGGAILKCTAEGAMSVLAAYSADNYDFINKQNICMAPDGNFWVTSGLGDGAASVGACIAKVTPGGQVTPYGGGPPFTNWLGTNAIPFGLCVGWDDNLWVVDNTTHVTDLSVFTTAGVPAPNPGGGNLFQFEGLAIGAGLMCIGPDGALWLLIAGNSIYKFPNGSYTPTHYNSGAGSEALGLCVGGDGNLWVMGQTAINTISTSGTVTSQYSSGTQLLGMCLGSDGNIWFTNHTGAGATSKITINRITPSAVVTTWTLFQNSTINVPDQIDSNLVSGPDGNIWTMAQTGVFNGSPPGNVSTLLRFNISTQVVTQFSLPTQDPSFTALHEGPVSYCGITVGDLMYFTAIGYAGPSGTPFLRQFQRDDAMGVRMFQAGGAANSSLSVRNQSAGNSYT